MASSLVVGLLAAATVAVAAPGPASADVGSFMICPDGSLVPQGQKCPTAEPELPLTIGPATGTEVLAPAGDGYEPYAFTVQVATQSYPPPPLPTCSVNETAVPTRFTLINSHDTVFAVDLSLPLGVHQVTCTGKSLYFPETVTYTFDVTVNAPPFITGRPADGTFYAGSTLAFLAFAVGYPEPAIQWAKVNADGVTTTDLPGKTSPQLVFPILTPADAGRYLVTFTNAHGTASTGFTVGVREGDPDPEPPAVSVDSVSIGEGDTGTTAATFTLALDAPSATPVTVEYATASGGASAADFTPTSGTATFAPGETSQTVSVLVTGDTTFEDDETFSLALSNPTGAVLGVTTGTGTIVNDDDPPTVSLLPGPTVIEGNGGAASLVFTATLSAPFEKEGYTFARRIVGGTANPGQDYTPLPGVSFDERQFTFGSDGTATITVPVLGDTVVEPDETVVLEIESGTTGGLSTPLAITQATSTGTIVNDDVASPAPNWFQRFAWPVSAAPAVNTIKAGLPVPIRFSLGGNRGLGIFAAGSPSTQQVSCRTWAPIGSAEPATTPAGTRLWFEPWSGLYGYPWKTARAWDDTCRTVTLSFTDGSSQTLRFRLR